MQILEILMVDGKVILSEMPDKYNPKKQRKAMLPHLTKLCNRLGLKQKDVISLEYVSWNYKEDEHPYYKERSDRERDAFKSALEGEQRLEPFYLFRYIEEVGFELLRLPIKSR